MLNSFQHLTASLYLPLSLGEILKQVQDDIVHGVICYLYTHFGEANSILLSKKLTTHRSSLIAQTLIAQNYFQMSSVSLRFFPGSSAAA